MIEVKAHIVPATVAGVVIDHPVRRWNSLVGCANPEIITTGTLHPHAIQVNPLESPMKKSASLIRSIRSWSGWSPV
ncbi:MAG: hypothetical protein V8T86_16070 [Victivallis sp.]